MGEYELLFGVPFKFVVGILWDVFKSMDTGDILLMATIWNLYMAWKTIKEVKPDNFYYYCTQTCIYGGILMALLCLTN